jgi:hypothetical protein
VSAPAELWVLENFLPPAGEIAAAE